MADQAHQPLERVPSGITKLDQILNGGFLRGGVYMIMGTPGAGKTILGNQLCFNHVKRGGKAVFMTLLAETHARMLAHIQSMDFFDPACIGEDLYYISGYNSLEHEGLAGLLKLIRQVLRERGATLFVVDGLATAEAIADTELSYRRFLHEMQVYIETVNCTGFLLTQPGQRTFYPEHTMVDGLVRLTDQDMGPRAIRELEIEKFRGSSYLRGRHIFEITSGGIDVHPRTEAVLRQPDLHSGEVRDRLKFGIRRLDDMLMGGVLSGSTTTLLGAPGTGKTVLGLHFLHEGAANGENVLYFGFYETPDRLLSKAQNLGLDMRQYCESGTLQLMWKSPLEEIPDAIVASILDNVRRHNVKRLFIDGLEPLRDFLIYPERTPRFFTALMNELRALNVTTLFTSELAQLFSADIYIPVAGISATIDNIIVLRYAELRSQLYRLISILKVRESTYDPAIREFRISENGIDVASTFESAEAILTGVVRPSAPGSTPVQSGTALLDQQTRLDNPDTHNNKTGEKSESDSRLGIDQ
jgi:circadian clock protein KaiC